MQSESAALTPAVWDHGAGVYRLPDGSAYLPPREHCADDHEWMALGTQAAVCRAAELAADSARAGDHESAALAREAARLLAPVARSTRARWLRARRLARPFVRRPNRRTPRFRRATPRRRARSPGRQQADDLPPAGPVLRALVVLRRAGLSGPLLMRGVFALPGLEARLWAEVAAGNTGREL
jgi:hypothetical protein